MYSFLIRTQNLASQDESATQDRYWPDRPGSWTGGSSATAPMVWKKIWVAPSVWPMAIFGLFGLLNTHILVCSAGQYPYFGLFGLANALVLVCWVWSIPLFWSVRSGQYPCFGLFRLANTLASVCSVWPIPIFLVCSVWPIPIFRSFWSGQYPYFGLFPLANTHILVCSVWPMERFQSVRSGHYPCLSFCMSLFSFFED